MTLINVDVASVLKCSIVDIVVRIWDCATGTGELASVFSEFSDLQYETFIGTLGLSLPRRTIGRYEFNFNTATGSHTYILCSIPSSPQVYTLLDNAHVNALELQLITISSLHLP